MGFFDNIVNTVQDSVASITDDDPTTNPELQQVFESLGADKIIEGIKEALTVATSRAIDITGKPGGFLNNDIIKIQMPVQVQTVTTALRAAGLGGIVDDFELSMNRAAEESAPLAGQTFITAITQMTFEDLQSIWNGSDKHAATNYLNRTCSNQLTASFTPKVTEAMDRNQVTQIFGDLFDKVEGIPFVQSILQGFDLEEYTVKKALEGIFTVMAEQEANVRENPAGTASSLIETVFEKQAFNV